MAKNEETATARYIASNVSTQWVQNPEAVFTHGQRSLGDRHVYAQRRRLVRTLSRNISRAGIGRDLKRPAPPGARREVTDYGICGAEGAELAG